MAYRHNDTLHKHKVRTTRIKKVAILFVMIGFVSLSVVGIDFLITKIGKNNTVVSRESSATVQSARINVFQTPFYRFQANESWREVTDELNLVNQEGSNQYLYRSFDKNFIEHEIWITVNLDADYKAQRYNIPTRVQPVRLESDKTLSLINNVSEPCSEVIPVEDKQRLQQIVVQEEVEYLCDPGINQYTVTVGTPGSTNVLLVPNNNGQSNSVTIIYRNVTAYPEPSEFDKILTTFKFL